MYSLTFDVDKSNKSQKPVAIVKGGHMPPWRTTVPVAHMIQMN